MPHLREKKSSRNISRQDLIKCNLSKKKQCADKMTNRSSESARFESIQEPGQAIAYGPGSPMLYIYPGPTNMPDITNWIQYAKFNVNAGYPLSK